MIKTKTLLEIKIDENIYLFECKPEAPLGEIHDAMCQMKAFVVQRMVEQQKIDESVKNEQKVEPIAS